MEHGHRHLRPIGTRMLFALVGVVGLVATLPLNAAHAQTKRVALLQYADSPLHEQGVGGMIAGLKAKGFAEGDTLDLTVRSAMRNTETAADIAQEMTAGGFDLILTSGTQALQAVANANQGGETVQVFGLVANPFNAGVGLDANDPTKHPRHLVGVGSFPPVDPLFEIAKELYPGLSVVGVVWNPGETNSRDSVEQARAIAAKLRIDLIEANAGTAEEVGDAARDLVSKGAEVLWIGADNTVHHAADAVIAAARQGNIPVMSSLPGDGERGALIDLSHDWHAVGQSVGEMAGDILAGADPSTIAIAVHPDRLRLVLNETALAGLTAPWSVPADVVARADEVIKPAN